MKCRVCRGPAVVDVRRHNANFCEEHFLKLCRDQVEKAIHDHRMLEPGDRVLVAVSGGKDSLALWDILLQLGYETDGLYLGLGIGDYSSESGRFATGFAKERGLNLEEVDISSEYGFDIPGGSRAARRAPCSACGLTKRHLFDEAATRGSYDALATGHNLDDEAAVLLGNVLRWEHEYLGRQRPVLPAGDGFPKKIKPLVRLGEREMAAYCVLRGIDYMVEECPMAEGNRHLAYKEALNGIEDRSPGTKHSFYFGFQERTSVLFAGAGDSAGRPTRCDRCGAPGNSAVCAFCRLMERAGGRLPAAPEPVPVELGATRSNGQGSATT
ncbi:MAG: adenine nucleotide alpha hydrolase family protein [Acidimicrobiia bacterium]|nr:adenine nucleotide alpha hydrolase family protein [Actinomycetota bacterium]MBL6925017.1 adenine nucleotide alpha hydrolase family protein [Acidimicrobiia bacterium]MBL6926966.1 adenine nucleotide alpha hydrolase family protein [Acidimicrobiia bacterium]